MAMLGPATDGYSRAQWPSPPQTLHLPLLFPFSLCFSERIQVALLLFVVVPLGDLWCIVLHSAKAHWVVTLCALLEVEGAMLQVVPRVDVLHKERD